MVSPLDIKSAVGALSSTSMVTYVVALQGAVVPVTEYVVVIEGVATGAGQEVHDNPEAGDHVKLVAPEAERFDAPPGHIVSLLEVTETSGVGDTITAAESIW